MTEATGRRQPFFCQTSIDPRTALVCVGVRLRAFHPAYKKGLTHDGQHQPNRTGSPGPRSRATAIIAPQVAVVRKADGQVGSLTFQNQLRFYFNFQPDPGFGDA
jgi:hypothetical protein